MDGFTKIKLEIEVAAKNYVQQHLIDNLAIEDDIKKGIDAAFKSIDFAKLMENSVKQCIEDAIKSSTDFGKIRNVVREKTDAIVEKYINLAVSKFYSDLDK